MKFEIEKNLDQKVDTKPWRNEDGSLKCDQELKVMAASWSPSTWEAYLSDIGMGTEVEDGVREEVTMIENDKQIIFSTENSLANFISDLKVQYFPRLAAGLKRAVEKLPKRQREVVILHFWEGLGHTEIGRRLNITRQSVAKQLERAAQKICAEILIEIGSRKHLAPDSQSNAISLPNTTKNVGNSNV